MDAQTTEIFDEIYRTNLVFEKDCYKLCGDAHCCNFSRYKKEFAFLSRSHVQELPLLPGEYQYLEAKGYLDQFGDFEHRVVNFELDKQTISYEAIVSPKEGCACNQGTRTTICRLYPLMPQYDADCRVVGVETIGIYEEIEKLGGIDAACKLTNLPFDQLSEFLRLTAAIGRSPQMAFHIEAFRKAKAMASASLAADIEAKPRKSVFSLFEMRALSGKLFQRDELRADLNKLHAAFFAG